MTSSTKSKKKKKTKKNKKEINILAIIFYALVVVGVVIISTMMGVSEILGFREYTPVWFMFTSWIAFFLLGIALIFFTIREKIKGIARIFLILTGASAAGFFIGVILHNLLYALGIITSSIVVLKYLFEILHVLFFLIAVVACPLGFLVGVVGSIVLFSRKKSKPKK